MYLLCSSGISRVQKTHAYSSPNGVRIHVVPAGYFSASSALICLKIHFLPGVNTVLIHRWLALSKANPDDWSVIQKYLSASGCPKEDDGSATSAKIDRRAFDRLRQIIRPSAETSRSRFTFRPSSIGRPAPLRSPRRRSRRRIRGQQQACRAFRHNLPNHHQQFRAATLLVSKRPI
jgi:hypothetical protein